MTWKHVLVLALALATMVLCAHADCAAKASEIAGYIAVGVIGNAMATPPDRTGKHINAGDKP